MPVAPARAAAFEILLRVGSGAGHCDELLRAAHVQSLSAPDRNLCTTLVMGTLRWQIALDAAIRSFLKRPGEKLDARIQLALRMGAFQLIHLDRIPPHAAISESVELAKSAGNSFAAGMVNAVLRNLSRSGARTARATFHSPAEMAEELGHPLWLVERWVHAYGAVRAQQICQFDQELPQTHLRLLSPEAESALQQEGIELAAGSFLSQARRVVQGDVTATDTYKRGLVRIQDEGSQLVAELAGVGESILDCCAAPGGKTAILAERNPQARVVACDASGRRLEQMKRLLASSAPSAKINYEVADAAQLGYREEFDLVLCDVPCSGTGTLARNPEIRHRLTAEGLPRQHRRQVQILHAAMRALRPGGRLIYATCSLEPEENAAVIDECLSTWPHLTRVPAEDQLEALEQSGALVPGAAETLRNTAFEDGYLRTLPGVHPCDGFFAAVLASQ